MTVAEKENMTRSARRLIAILEGAGPEQILKTAIASVARGKLAISSSFGIESAILLHLAATVDPNLPVIFLDTGSHFSETLAYRDSLVRHLGLRDVRTIRPTVESIAGADSGNDLWARDADACCRLRKVVPLAKELEGLDAWVTGRKRFHGGQRLALPIVEVDGYRLKFNPFAGSSQKDIAERFRAAKLPPHPLEAAGYLSVGCLPCSSRAQAGEGARDGRWRGRSKTECGIHVTRVQVKQPRAPD